MGGLTFGTHEFDVRRSDASDRLAFASSWSAATRVSWRAFVAESSVVAGRAVPTVRLSGVVQVALRLAWAWARCAVVGSAATSITIVAALARLAVHSFGVVLAKYASAERIAAAR